MNERRNSTAWIFIAFAVIFVIGTICAFVLVNAYTTNFWFSYFGCFLALCGLGFGIWSTSRSVNQPASYLTTTVSIVYVVLTIIVVVVGNIVKFDPAWLGVVLLILFALYVVMMIISSVAFGNISSQKEREQRQVNRSRFDTDRVQKMVEETIKLPDNNREIARKALIDVEEKLRYSDPVSSSKTKQQANEMNLALNDLQLSLEALIKGESDIEDLENKAKYTIQTIDDYNRAKMMAK